MFGFGCFKCSSESENIEIMSAEEEAMVSKADMSDDSKQNQKITGCLEKKGKLKLVNSWKRYWFVLKGNLLLYYGSKEEYDALSPVKGRITLGPTCNVKPYPSTPEKFQITSRSGSVITLKADSISEQNKWMKAIYSAVNENQNIDISPTKLNHFRYSTERLDAIINNSEQKKKNQSPCLPDAGKSLPKPLRRDDSNLIDRLQRMGARSYSNSMSFNNHSPKTNDFTSELNERLSKTDHASKETGCTSPKKLQFSPKVPEKPKDKKVILEEDDFCVCTLEKDKKAPEPNKRHRNINLNQSTTVEEKNEPDKHTHEEIQTSPREKLRILKEKLQPPKKPTIAKRTKVSKHTDDEATEGIFENESEKIKPEIKHIIKDRENEEAQQEKINDISKPPDSPKVSVPIKKRENVGSIKVKEDSKVIDQEKHSSYLDFRENELYADLHKNSISKVNQDGAFEASDHLYCEPDCQMRREKPDFEFPPPPSDLYESAIDLTSNKKYEDDCDSLYEEADDNVEFVWQNEIYASSLNQSQNTLYDEPNFQKDIQLNSDEKGNKTSPTEEEFKLDEDLYEEVDKDFTFQKETENNIHKNGAIPVTTSEHTNELFLENDLYEEVDEQTQMNYEKHKEVEENQMKNDVYTQVNKHSTETHNHEDIKDKEKVSSFTKTNKDYRDKEKIIRDSKTDVEVSQQSISSRNNDPNNTYISRKNFQMRNEIYGVFSGISSANSSQRKEIQLENDLYAINDSNNERQRVQATLDKEKQLENDLYSVPNEIFFKDLNLNVNENKRKELITTQEAEKQMENDLYSVPNEIFFKDSNQNVDKNKRIESIATQDKEKQIENDLYSVPNEIFFEDPNQNVNENKRREYKAIQDKEKQMENDLYAVPNEVFFKDSNQNNDENKRQELVVNSVREIQMENDLYAVPSEIFSGDSDKNRQQVLATKSKELQMENDIYAVPNEVFFKDSNETNIDHIRHNTSSRKKQNEYAEPNEVFCENSSERKKQDRQLEIENDLYAEPNINSSENSRHNTQNESESNLYTEPDFKLPKTPKKPIFSRQNSRTDTESKDNLSKSPETGFFKSNFLEKLLHKKHKRGCSTDEENSVDLENELYAQPNLTYEDSGSHHENQNFDDCVGPCDNFEGNGYEDPDKLMLRPQMSKEHSLKKKKIPKSDTLTHPTKGKEEKKHDSFIQRLLKQATKKHTEKGEKMVDLASRDESLALLSEIQVLLEKKKKEIKEMVATTSKPNHRRILSDSITNCTNIDQCGASSLKKSLSIDLNDEYSLVLDHLEDKEAIYSEVEMVNRRSRELKDLIEEILKRNKNSLPGENEPTSLEER